MAAKEKQPDERNLNITLRQEERLDENEVIISLPTLWRKLKKYFLAWILVAIIIGGLISGISIFFSTTSSTPVRALISFNYNGIEKGKNPDGSDFDPMNLKNPRVLEKALTNCGIELTMTEAVRMGIDVDGVIPSDALDRLTAYDSVLDKTNNGQMNVMQQILDTTWYPTQFRVTFNYREAGITRSRAVEVLNAILDAYRDFFFEKFGYNEAFGTALSAEDYSDYDYPQAVDAMSTTLSQLRRYVTNVATSDTSRFRSSTTGLTFADLRESIDSVITIDLAMVTSFINTNNVTKDKERAKAYYDYRIEQLEAMVKSYETQLATISETIEAYERGDVFIFGAGNDNTDMQTKESSAQYDKMVSQKLSVTADIAESKRDIEYYEERLRIVKQTAIGGTSKVKIVEEDLAKIKEKIDRLVKQVNETADEYYQNVSLSNSYNILVPASFDAVSTIKSGISGAIIPILGIEALLFVVYLTIAFSQAIREDFFKKQEAIKKSGKAGNNDQDADAEKASETE